MRETDALPSALERGTHMLAYHRSGAALSAMLRSSIGSKPLRV